MCIRDSLYAAAHLAADDDAAVPLVQQAVANNGVRGEMKLELWCDGVAFLTKVGRLYTCLLYTSRCV